MPSGEIYKIDVDESGNFIKIINDNMNFILIGIIVILLICIYNKYKNKEKSDD